MKLIDMQVKEYLEVLKSDAPAPGGGSAAGLFGTSSAAHVLHKALRKRDQPEGHPIGHGA